MIGDRSPRSHLCCTCGSKVNGSGHAGFSPSFQLPAGFFFDRHCARRRPGSAGAAGHCLRGHGRGHLRGRRLRPRSRVAAFFSSSFFPFFFFSFPGACAAGPIGVPRGQLLAGFLGPRMGWRMPFVVAAWQEGVSLTRHRSFDVRTCLGVAN